MKIIGLGHYSRTGKDTFANFIQSQLVKLQSPLIFQKRSLAWKLKEICHDLYGWAGLQHPEFYDTPEGATLRDVPLDTLGLTPVQVWVQFGTHAVRNNVYENTWLDYLIKGVKGVDVLVVPDIRFTNEFEAFQKAGGMMFKIVRPGYGPRNTIADRKLMTEDRWDFVIGAGGLTELNQWASSVATHLVFGTPLPVQTSHDRSLQLSVENT